MSLLSPAVDLVIILDASSDATGIFSRMISFVSELLSTMTQYRMDYRIGVMCYRDSVVHKFYLNDITNEGDIRCVSMI